MFSTSFLHVSLGLVTSVLAFSAWPRTLLRMMLHAHIEVDGTIARSAIASASNHWESWDLWVGQQDFVTEMLLGKFCNLSSVYPKFPQGFMAWDRLGWWSSQFSLPKSDSQESALAIFTLASSALDLDVESYRTLRLSNWKGRRPARDLLRSHSEGSRCQIQIW